MNSARHTILLFIMCSSSLQSISPKKEILIGVINEPKLLPHANALKKILEFDEHADVIIETFAKNYSKNDIIAFFVKGNNNWVLKNNEWMCVADEEIGLPSRRVIILSCREKDIEWQVYDRCYCWHDGPEIILLKAGNIKMENLSASGFALQLTEEIGRCISDPVFDQEAMAHHNKKFTPPILNDDALDSVSDKQ